MQKGIPFVCRLKPDVSHSRDNFAAIIFIYSVLNAYTRTYLFSKLSTLPFKWTIWAKNSSSPNFTLQILLGYTNNFKELKV